MGRGSGIEDNNCNLNEYEKKKKIYTKQCLEGKMREKYPVL